MRAYRGFVITFHVLLIAATISAQDIGEHPDWPRWCGKAYLPGYPSFDPGGQTVEPADTGVTNLHVQFKPRYNLYVEGEKTGSFIVNAILSPWHGVPYKNSTSDGETTEPFDQLFFSINFASTNLPLVQNSIEVDTTGAEFAFDLSAFTPSTTPYEMVLSGASRYGEQAVNTTSSVWYLPDNPSGSVTKIDNLMGGLLFKKAGASSKFEPLLPYGYYALYNGSTSSAASDDFVRNFTTNGQGLNSIIALTSFEDSNPVYDSMDSHELSFMYDLRSSYLNLSDIEQHVNAVKHHANLFAYWTADEPDGHQDPLDAPMQAQQLVHALDPYHPVAVTLNCQDFHFDTYSLGADILMEDTYPIAINTTFSQWETPCNATFGDCGCDNCAGAVQDVSARLDVLAQHERWLGRWPLPKFHNPQAFHGDGYWSRDPTAGEARVMSALALNRGTTGLFAWMLPGSWELFRVHSDIAAVVTRPPVRDFLLGARPTRLPLQGPAVLDGAYWVLSGRMLVSVVNGGYVDVKGGLSIRLPVPAFGLQEVAFGRLPWTFANGNLSIGTLPAMSSSLIVLNTV